MLINWYLVAYYNNTMKQVHRGLDECKKRLKNKMLTPKSTKWKRNKKLVSNNSFFL